MTIQELCQLFGSYLLEVYNQREIDSLWRILNEDLALNEQLNNKSQFDRKWEDWVVEVTNRIKSGEPIQYITGKEIFYGLEFEVNNAVLIPRPETEELVHWIYNYCNEQRPDLVSASVFEVGTGSGCISLTLKHLNNQFDIEAIDKSDKALNIATKNGDRMKLDVLFDEMNFLDQNQWKNKKIFDILISNPPYIPLREKTLMESNVLDHEPHMALFVEDDPFVFYKTIIEFSREHLSPNGLVFVECNEFNADEVVVLFENAGFLEVELKKDMQGKNRMVRAGSHSPST